jgi:hypothetical protein
MSENKQRYAVNAILLERLRQDEKWGEQNHDPITYSVILGEEYGELCQAALHAKFGGDPGNDKSGEIRKEAIHCAAVALAIIECLDRGKWKWSEQSPATGEWKEEETK